MLKKPVVIYRKAFTVNQCNRLITLIHSNIEHDILPGTAGKQLNFATINKFSSSPILELCHKLLFLIRRANDHNFQFDEYLFQEDNVYVNRYSAGKKGQKNDHRGWHTDGVLGDKESEDGGVNYLDRKLSALVQLSPSDSYAGGDIEFMSYHQPSGDLRGIGTVLVFPAFEWHRVTPVTKHTRYSMVMFTAGNAFK